MTFRQFAFNNVARNKRLYAAYFLSSMFTVMVFFTFSIFAFHPALSGDDMNSSVAQGMNIAAGIIYVFSFFFILYSMSSFLQSRKKEFGLLMIHGMSMKQIRSMVFLENMIIGFFATLGGIVLGLVFAKAILLLAENVLIIDNKLNFYIPSQAVVLTFVSFIVLFFFISVFVSFVLRSGKLIDLLKGDKKSKGEPKASLLLTLLAALLLGGGYAIAFVVKGMLVIAAMLPVTVMVIIGTYLLFTQLSVFVIRRLKNKESFSWRHTNMILFSDLSYRMKDNARTFFLVAIISTVAFSAIGTLYGFQTFLSAGIEKANPNTFTYYGDEQEEQDVARINATLQEEHMKANKAHAELHYYDAAGDSVLIVKQSDYNRFAELIGEETVNVKDGQTFLVKSEALTFGLPNKQQNRAIELESGVVLDQEEILQSSALPSSDYYIVSDNDYEKLPAPADIKSYHAWQATEGKQHVLSAAEKLYQQLPYEVTSGEYDIYQLNKGYGPIMFVGLFIGIVFFVSAGSFLYFRLYTDVDGDKQKFKMIAKMGLSEKELKKVLTRQTAILFFAPIIVALIHGAVALTALSHLFFYNLAKESAIVLGVFLLIQIIYFFVVRLFYTKQIQAAVHL
ncbi:ABC transporter permease [Paenibacillus nanensis]|uniref:ABC transporter permease n=1 Tax=Paenibacillus nanensis TaxID=393251 RepID=A0A3A1UQA8_9BACL|nr:ABC transporter permease [Paenibacillus nanensis]RIX50737.1 ABC transporter permease [Paenibacillus nanensis]